MNKFKFSILTRPRRSGGERSSGINLSSFDNWQKRRRRRGHHFSQIDPPSSSCSSETLFFSSLRGEFHIFKDPRGKDLQTHKQGWCKQRLAPCKTTLKSSPNSSMSRRHVYVKNILYYSYYLVKEKSNRCSNTILPTYYMIWVAKH